MGAEQPGAGAGTAVGAASLARMQDWPKASAAARPQRRPRQGSIVALALLGTVLLGLTACAGQPPTPAVAPASATAAAPLAAIPAAPARVAVDVGHSLAAPGATSARGTSEFDFNRNLAQVLRPALESRGIPVQPVNFDGLIDVPTDSGSASGSDNGNANSLQARVDAAAGSAFLLSLHHDSVQPYKLIPWTWMGRHLDYSDEYRGFVFFVSHRNPQLAKSLACASAMGRALRQRGFVPATHHGTTPAGTPRPWADEENGVRFYDTLYVISHSPMPAALFEAGMLKNREEELLLQDRGRQGAMAGGLAEGVATCIAEGKEGSQKVNSNWDDPRP